MQLEILSDSLFLLEIRLPVSFSCKFLILSGSLFLLEIRLPVPFSCKFLIFPFLFCSFMVIKFPFGNTFDSDMSVFYILAMLYIDYNFNVSFAEEYQLH